MNTLKMPDQKTQDDKLMWFQANMLCQLGEDKTAWANEYRKIEKAHGAEWRREVAKRAKEKFKKQSS